MPTGVSTRPCFSASARAASRPASRRSRKPSSGRAASLAPMNMPSRANAAIGQSMPSTSRCSRSTSGMMRPAALLDVTRMPWLPSGKSSREQPQVASMPGDAPKPRRRSSRIAPFCGSRSAELRDLSPVRIGRSEHLEREGCRIGRAEHAGADRIGPQDPRAVGRPQPCGQGAGCVQRQSRIAEHVQLEFRIIHRDDMTVRVRLFALRWLQKPAAKRWQPWRIASIASAERQVHGPATAALSKAGITLIRSNRLAAVRVGVLQTAIRGPR